MIAVNPTDVPSPFGDYRHAVLAGSLLVTSGQLAVTEGEPVPNDVGRQAEICFEHIRRILYAVDMGFEHVIRFNAYVTRREHMPLYMEARDRVLSHLTVKPASTLMIVSGFTRAEFLVEVEAMALRGISTDSQSRS